MLQRIVKNIMLSDNWYILRKYIFEYKKRNGIIETHTREVYDRGNGAAVLLFNKKKNSVILTKQFRLPTYLNGNKTGMSIEVCAGMLDEKDPKKCIIRETREETGYNIQQACKVMEAYMSPGAVTEIIHFFTAECSDDMKIYKGGGRDDEDEEIEVLEYSFEKAYSMIETGEIKDAKTIMLLQYAKINALLE